MRRAGGGIVGGAGVGIVNLLTSFGDGYSSWVLNRSTQNGSLGARIATIGTLASDASGFVNGVDLVIDGGLLTGNRFSSGAAARQGMYDLLTRDAASGS